MFNKYAWATLVWAIISTASIAIPGKMVPRITGTANLIFDNVSHFGIFLILAFLLSRSLTTRIQPFTRLRAANISFLATSVYGFLLEIVQIPLPGRAFEWSDAFANCIGALAGVLIAGFWVIRSERKI